MGERQLAKERDGSMREALVDAASRIELAVEESVSQVRRGEISVPEGIDHFLSNTLHEVLGGTKPKLILNLIKGEDPHWVLLRRLRFAALRLACQPLLPRGRVDYVDFKTGVIQPAMPP